MKSESPSLFRYYADELRRVLRRWHWAWFFLSSTMHALGHAFLALVAGGLAIALARAWGSERGGASGPATGAPLEVLWLTGIGLAVVLVKATAGVYATFVQARIAGEVGSSLRLRLLGALLAGYRLRRPRHGDQGEGRTPAPAVALAALTERVRDVELGLDAGVLHGARSLAQLVPLGALLFVLSAQMASVAAVVLGGFGVALARLRAAYRRATQREASERERLLEAADEAVRHADLWVTYGAEAKVYGMVESLGHRLARGAARLEARAAALSGGNEVLAAAALVVAVAASRAGWVGAARGETLLAFAVAFFLAYRPLRELAEARLALARAQAAYDELRRVIDAPQETAVAPLWSLGASSGRREWPAAALELRGLRLPWGRCQPLSLRVAPGAIVAVCGPTGIGKTTLLRTLLGLDRAAGGTILFDGQPIDEAPAGPTARPFAWVPQEAPLLADTLAANVTLGAPPDVDVRATLDPIGAAHLAARLDGARLGPGGRMVSGGERQWIALARAIATRQPVLLLDEPTSGLDAGAQHRVLEAIARLRGRRTVLIVTHRPEPLAVADAVVTLRAEEPPACD
jgi:ABC-type multidrug transport system fused ATPase/permease subunit